MSQNKNCIEFHCLEYNQLPDFGIYLDQMLSVVNDALECILSEPITSPMINNYIKNKALPPAVKKRYYRDHVCRLIIIGILKQVFSVQQIARFFEIVEHACALEDAYACLCEQFAMSLGEEVAKSVCGSGPVEANDVFRLIGTMARTAACRVNAERQLVLFSEGNSIG